MRAIAQEISYEIPLVLALLSLILVSRSLDFYEVAEQQSAIPFVLIQVVGLSILALFPQIVTIVPNLIGN